MASLQTASHMWRRNNTCASVCKKCSSWTFDFLDRTFQTPISSSSCMYFLFLRHRNHAKPWKKQPCTAVKGSLVPPGLPHIARAQSSRFQGASTPPRLNCCIWPPLSHCANPNSRWKGKFIIGSGQISNIPRLHHSGCNLQLQWKDSERNQSDPLRKVWFTS